MSVTTHWKVTIGTRESGDAEQRAYAHAWKPDQVRVQMDCYSEMLYQLNVNQWEYVEKALKSYGAEVGAITLRDLELIHRAMHEARDGGLEKIGQTFGLQSHVFPVIDRCLRYFGITVAVAELQMTDDQFQRLVLTHVDDIAEQTLIELIALKKAAS